MALPKRAFAGLQPKHFAWRAGGNVGVVTIDRPDKKNPLTFDSYAELRDLFRGLQYASDVKAVVVTGAGGNFSSGGDVQDRVSFRARRARRLRHGRLHAAAAVDRSRPRGGTAVHRPLHVGR